MTGVTESDLTGVDRGKLKEEWKDKGGRKGVISRAVQRGQRKLEWREKEHRKIIFSLTLHFAHGNPSIGDRIQVNQYFFFVFDNIFLTWMLRFLAKQLIGTVSNIHASKVF